MLSKVNKQHFKCCLLQIGTTAPASKLHVGVDSASANYGTVSIGAGAFNGSTAGYFGTSSSSNSSGTVLALNAALGYVGDLVNFQVGGASKFKEDASGSVTIAGQTELGSSQALTTANSAVTRSLGDSRWNSPFAITTVQTGGNNSWGNIQMGILPFMTGRPDATVAISTYSSSPPNVRFVPCWINGNKTITSATIKIIAGMHATETIRAALYDSDSAGMPKNRVGSQWNWPTAAAGKVTASIGTVNLTRGLYWLALQNSVGATAWGGSLTVLGYPVTNIGLVAAVMGTVVSGWDIYEAGALPTAYGWSLMPSDASTGVISIGTSGPSVR
jgi:hypothetical protein